MKKYCIILSFILCFFMCAFKVERRQDIVYHFFTHALLADKNLAFSKENPMRMDYDRDCLTVDEFRGILYELYANDFILVDIYDVFENGKKKNLTISGKKPMLLSFDDINYYVKKMHLGMNDKLICDSARNIATQTDNVISYDNEVITVLENFIAENPSFSYKGARGILCLTGFDGILGYRTNFGSPTCEIETLQARQVVEALREKGWRFACHSYGHPHMRTISASRFENDTNKWLKEVSPILGATELYVYPYGEWDMGIKQEYLMEKGFSLFFGVGLAPYYSSMSLKNKKRSCLFMDRIPLDGRTLRKYADTLSVYFDVFRVYDSSRPIALF